MTQPFVPSGLSLRRRFFRLCILLPLRLSGGVSICCVFWLISVSHCVLSFVLHSRQGRRRISGLANASSRVKFVNEWLSWRFEEEDRYPAWFIYLHKEVYLRMALFFAKSFLLSLGYVRAFIRGSIAEDVDIFISNHRGILDTLLLTFALGRVPIFVAGRDTLRVPFLREVAIACDAIVVDHENDGSRQVASDILRYIVERKSRQICIFPEGQPQCGYRLDHWIHPGCFGLTPSVRMQPVGLVYLGLGEYVPSWIVYLDQLISHLVQLAQVESNHAGIMFLAKITPPPDASNDDIMELYRIAIARALDVPIKLKGSDSFRLPHEFSE